MSTWKFYINDVQVSEPIGWDSVEFRMMRSDNFTGLENEYSDDLTFDGNGAKIIKDKLNLEGIDGQLTLKIQEFCKDVLVDELIGPINLITFKQDPDGLVTVKFEESEFSRKFKNRLDVPVDLELTESLDGVDIGQNKISNIRLHSKAIVYTSTLRQNPFFLSYSMTSPPAGSRYVGFPLQIEINTLNETREPVDIEQGVINEIFYSGDYPTGQTNRRIKVKGNLAYKLTYRNTVYDFAIQVIQLDGTVLWEDQLAFLSASAILKTTDVNINIDYELDFPEGTYLNLSARVEIADGLSLAQFDYSPDSYIILSEESTYPSTSAKSIFIYEALNKVAEIITDTTDCIRSDFFGRINSTPHAYSINGCGSWLAVTNGVNLRNMIDKDGNLFPITASWNQLYQALDAIYNIGMRIEKVNGKYYIRIEPKEFFFDQETILTFTGVSDIERTIATDLLYNELEVGYDKWEVEEVNGIDEFNTKRNYSIPLKNAKKKLTATSKVIAGGYAIETTRRLQYSDNPNRDSKYDNDLFFICLNPNQIGFDTSDENPYHTDGQLYPVVYEPGEVAERNENFDSIENLLSPETSYNLRISPLRNAQRQYKSIGASLYGKTDPVVKFVSGTGNVKEKDQLTDACSDSDALISQDMDIISGDIAGLNADPLFKPFYLNFSVPFTREQYNILRENSHKSIEIGCGNTPQYKGSLKELKFFPNVEGGIAEIKLIETGCTLGAFDEGFNEGYDIGTC